MYSDSVNCSKSAIVFIIVVLVIVHILCCNYRNRNMGLHGILVPLGLIALAIGKIALTSLVQYLAHTSSEIALEYM